MATAGVSLNCRRLSAAIIRALSNPFITVRLTLLFPKWRAIAAGIKRKRLPFIKRSISVVVVFSYFIFRYVSLIDESTGKRDRGPRGKLFSQEERADTRGFQDHDMKPRSHLSNVSRRTGSIRRGALLEAVHLCPNKFPSLIVPNLIAS